MLRLVVCVYAVSDIVYVRNSTTANLNPLPNSGMVLDLDTMTTKPLRWADTWGNALLDTIAPAHPSSSVHHVDPHAANKDSAASASGRDQDQHDDAAAFTVSLVMRINPGVTSLHPPLPPRPDKNMCSGTLKEGGCVLGVIASLSWQPQRSFLISPFTDAGYVRAQHCYVYSVVGVLPLRFSCCGWCGRSFNHCLPGVCQQQQHKGCAGHHQSAEAAVHPQFHSDRALRCACCCAPDLGVSSAPLYMPHPHPHPHPLPLPLPHPHPHPHPATQHRHHRTKSLSFLTHSLTNHIFAFNIRGIVCL